MSNKTVAELMALAGEYANEMWLTGGLPGCSAVDEKRTALEQAIRRAVDWEQVAWIDSNGHPHHMSELQGVRDQQLYGRWAPLYARRQDQ